MEAKEDKEVEAELGEWEEGPGERSKKTFSAGPDPIFEEFLGRSSDPRRDEELKRKMQAELDLKIEQAEWEIKNGDMDRRFLGWSVGGATVSISRVTEGDTLVAIRNIRESEVREVFDRRRSISDVKEVFKVKRSDLKAFLAGIGVTFEEEIRRNRDALMSLREIAELHASSVKTVGKVLRAAGYDIRPGNSLPNDISRKELEPIFAKKKTINAVAKELGIHWETSEKALMRAGVLPKKDTE